MPKQLQGKMLIMKTLTHYIDGQQVIGTSGRFGDVYDPSQGKIIAQAPLASVAEVEQAIESAKKALPGWKKTPAAKRAQIMFRFRELIIENTDKLAEMLSSEHGKTLEDARGSIGRGLEVVEYACGIPALLSGSHSKGVASAIDTFNVREPVGIVAGITPFNFPAMVPMWMFPMALACGNTFILKPSEKDPSCSLFLAQLMTQAGLPNGCLNVVNGDKLAVDTILEHPDISGVSFVGSTQIGRYIYEKGCAAGKRVQSLCGAKNHMVVMPDADIDQAVAAVLGAAYGSAGERCMAISVLIAVGDDVADAVLAKLTPKVESLHIGPYTDSQAEMGPVITQESKERIEGYISRGVEEGATLVVDGRNHQVVGYENGFFVGGTIFDNVKPKMSIYTDEIFGPVLCVVRVSSYEEAKELIINHEYGNGTAIFTRNGGIAQDFSESVNVGMIGVNVPIPVPVAFHSFGGWKNSLFGDHSIYGMEGVRFYTRLKTITQRWPGPDVQDAVFHFRASRDDS